MSLEGTPRLPSTFPEAPSDAAAPGRRQFDGMARIAVVVHPTRNIDATLQAARDWAAEHESEVLQLAVAAQRRQVAQRCEADECDKTGREADAKSVHAGTRRK